jgi:hypothetical protein
MSLLVIGLYAVGLVASAQAQEQSTQPVAPGQVACQVRTILADNRPGGIDRRLADFPQLGRPPFSAYKRIELLGTRPLTLPPLGSGDLDLPNGRVLKLTFHDKIAQAGRARLRLELSIGRPRQRALSRTTLVMDDGDTVFHAGQPYRSGTLILAITCRAK